MSLGFRRVEEPGDFCDGKMHSTKEVVSHIGSSTFSRQDLFRLLEVSNNSRVSFLTSGSSGRKTAMASIHKEKYSGKICY